MPCGGPESWAAGRSCVQGSSLHLCCLCGVCGDQLGALVWVLGVQVFNHHHGLGQLGLIRICDRDTALFCLRMLLARWWESHKEVVCNCVGILALKLCQLLCQGEVTNGYMKQQCTYDGRYCSSLLLVCPDGVEKVQELCRLCGLVNQVLVCSTAKSVAYSGGCID